ncbi:hypothetical protein AB434_3490 [Heyndrickxia coagulans]|uniref:Uncharacterized protein n=1 Tax=Heyndrickxia coagulans TaxID=1398 RepID=A0A0C5C6W5_HEYCO|nr:hypothetical protein SB48_HM08orf02826 [Heyndrickxia coagulans]AKN55895.1 hypothetical protein AB434_3490 [Heyndrickxia coagulans]KWZ84082.1 hypothetical protein HMPREF3213_01141 [Heyndrickxia coagulans]KYC61920.1 hypothetical protein B4100_3059 [Heyndrickxia coagulans]KYC91723.1 hypothetical protein B4096_2678 [Heyndrickxia coagulans]
MPEHRHPGWEMSLLHLYYIGMRQRIQNGFLHSRPCPKYGALPEGWKSRG